jgi:hypothetical protein
VLSSKLWVFNLQASILPLISQSPDWLSGPSQVDRL